MAGTESANVDGKAQTVQQATSARAAAEAAAAARQGQAARFQRENGAGARNHTDVLAGQKTGRD
jgi:hypothetical protein